MIYEIPEINIPLLEKRLKNIQKKCEKYNCQFIFKKTGEVYKPYTNNNITKNIKYIVCDVSGIAKIDNWELIASIDHTPEGNIIKGYNNSPIPKKFYDSPSICEHCNKKRSRNETFIIHNIETDEYKQVGRTCLLDYTGSLSAEHAATLESLFHNIKEYSNIDSDGFSFSKSIIYENLDTLLLYSIETIKKLGYHKKDTDIISGNTPTAYDVYDFLYVYSIRDEHRKNEIMNRMSEIQFNPDTEENILFKNKIKEWISTCEDNSAYIHNLKVIFSSDMVNMSYLGILASSIPAYYRAHPDTNSSHFVGTVGEKISFDIESFKCVYSYEAFRGTTYIYRILDTDGNTYIWKTMKPYSYNSGNLSGTVKAHNEYRGVKQTELTRCKINNTYHTNKDMISSNKSILLDLD